MPLDVRFLLSAQFAVPAVSGYLLIQRLWRSLKARCIAKRSEEHERDQSTAIFRDSRVNVRFFQSSR
jgi:hypothetical protein